MERSVSIVVHLMKEQKPKDNGGADSVGGRTTSNVGIVTNWITRIFQAALGKCHSNGFVEGRSHYRAISLQVLQDVLWLMAPMKFDHSLLIAWSSLDSSRDISIETIFIEATVVSSGVVNSCVPHARSLFVGFFSLFRCVLNIVCSWC